MQSENWIDLLKKIPAEYQHNLMLVTSVGLEISIQTVLHLQDNYLAIRGRLAGTTDTGRVYFVPYTQINFLCVQKPMQAEDITAMFGLPPGEMAKQGPLTGEVPPEPAAEVEDVEKTQPVPQPIPLPDPEELPRSPVAPKLSRSELLARIRSRSQGGGGNGPSPGQ